MNKLLGFLFGVGKPKGAYNADATRSSRRQSANGGKKRSTSTKASSRSKAK